VFLAGGSFGGGAVAGVESAQAEVDLDAASFALDGADVVVAAGAAAVLAYEGGGDVDVVVGVADGDPAAGFLGEGGADLPALRRGAAAGGGVGYRCFGATGTSEDGGGAPLGCGRAIGERGQGGPALPTRL